MRPITITGTAKDIGLRLNHPNTRIRRPEQAYISTSASRIVRKTVSRTTSSLRTFLKSVASASTHKAPDAGANERSRYASRCTDDTSLIFTFPTARSHHGQDPAIHTERSQCDTNSSSDQLSAESENFVSNTNSKETDPAIRPREKNLNAPNTYA